MQEDPKENLDLFDEHEEVVSENGKEVKRRGIFLLPNLLTTAALFSGFFSIISAIDGNFVSAGMAIFAAQMLDGLDGRVARLTSSQSAFGAQYDSLSDVISFGLAPAIIIFLWGLNSIGSLCNPLALILSPPVNSFINPTFNFSDSLGSSNTANLFPLDCSKQGVQAFDAALFAGIYPAIAPKIIKINVENTAVEILINGSVIK